MNLVQLKSQNIEKLRPSSLLVLLEPQPTWDSDGRWHPNSAQTSFASVSLFLKKGDEVW